MLVSMVLVFVSGAKTLGVAGMGPGMILLIGAHITVGVSNSHIADVEGDANSGIGRNGASQRRSCQNQRNRCAFQDRLHLYFPFGFAIRRRRNAQKPFLF